jgi:hypothetical protein
VAAAAAIPSAIVGSFRYMQGGSSIDQKKAIEPAIDDFCRDGACL